MAKEADSTTAKNSTVKQLPQWPIGQSSNVYGRDAHAANVLVRNVTPYWDETLQANKFIVSFDATTTERLQMVMTQFKDELDNGAPTAPDKETGEMLVVPIKARNLSYNVLPVYGKPNDFTGRFIPAKGEHVRVAFGEVTSKAGNKSWTIIGMSPVAITSATKFGLKDIMANINKDAIVETA